MATDTAIEICRKAWESKYFSGAKKYTEREAFLWLVTTASMGKRTVRIGNIWNEGRWPLPASLFLQNGNGQKTRRNRSWRACKRRD